MDYLVYTGDLNNDNILENRCRIQTKISGTDRIKIFLNES